MAKLITRKDVISDEKFAELLTMAPLTKEQKEYMELKFATERFMAIFHTMQDDGKISKCHNFETKIAPDVTKFRFESMFYKYLEVLQKEQEEYKKQNP